MLEAIKYQNWKSLRRITNSLILEEKRSIVPTHVGVNRQIAAITSDVNNCPHACGGEPIFLQLGMVLIMIVPTHVGVNRNMRK